LKADRLFVEIGDARKAMEDASIFGASGSLFGYEAELDVADEDTDIFVLLEREPPHQSAWLAGTFPPSFEIEPLDEESVSRSDDVQVQWDPVSPDDELELAIRGDCVEDAWTEVEIDTGSHTIEAGTIVGGDLTSCAVDLEITRSREGVVNVALHPESEITLQQRRSFSFESTP
jgi:hypothetical protein